MTRSESDDEVPLSKRSNCLVQCEMIKSGPATPKEAGISTAAQNGDRRKRKSPMVKTESTNSADDSDDDIIPLSQARTNNRRSVVKAPIKEEDSSDDDIPLAKRKKAVKRIVKEIDDSSEDDTPLAKRTTVKKQAAKKEDSSDDDTPLAKKQQKAKQAKTSKPSLKRETTSKEKSPVKKVKKEAKAKKVEEEEEVYRWWAEEAERNDSNEPGDDGVRWTSLAHYGVLFPPEYVPHGIQMKYDGKPVILTPEAEEKHVDKIRSSYTTDLMDKSMETRQRATAMYLIDRLALRAGNEKGDDEADTVGCCSLRYEHIELEAPNIVHFDFLGKDSIRYQNTVKVEVQVYKNLKMFKKQVGPGHTIFDRLTTSGLNKHLTTIMPGLSAKVFRTYNASFTCQQQLDKLTKKKDAVADKILSFNRANREVAVLCNHQRAVSKTHAVQMEKIADKIRATKYERMKTRQQIFTIDKSMKTKRRDLAEDESDLDDDWIKEYEVKVIDKELDKIKAKFQKDNEKLDKPLPGSELKDRLKKRGDELKTRLAKERKTGKVESPPSATVEKLLAKVEKIDERLNAIRVQATDREENKEISLGTSKLNYIDPRIIVSWCRKHDVPMEKVYSRTLKDKFRWAQDIPDGWSF
ncbi:hypothetical protein [Absidia glauca]|uniref:DNA topoisomerase I n=1 Tax=Absidia glauca TaxID=4829 RepID=A0A163K8K5_ABSGL|nr:hypothetical protein [Absidia glauca]